MDLPPPPKTFRELRDWAQLLYEEVRKLQPMRSANTLLRRGSYGNSRVPLEDETIQQTESGTIQFKGEWDPTLDYVQNDIVTVNPSNFPDQAGTYIAQVDAPAGGERPGDDNQGASGTWVPFAFGHWGAIQLDNPQNLEGGIASQATVQRALLDVTGQNPYGNGNPVLVLAIDASNLDSGGVLMDTNVIAGKKLYFQKLVTCGADGVPKQRWFLCSDEFDL